MIIFINNINYKKTIQLTYTLCDILLGIAVLRAYFPTNFSKSTQKVLIIGVVNQNAYIVIIMTLSELNSNIAIANQQKLSGGITCNGLKVVEINKSELKISGDVTVTLKVLDLTTGKRPNLSRLISMTQGFISSKLSGKSSAHEVFLQKYDAKKNVFDPRGAAFYTLRYDINYLVRVEQISGVGSLCGNEFVLAVVDYIGYNQIKGNGTRGLTVGAGGPATVAYKEWIKSPITGTHEFFHTLNLDDVTNDKHTERLMYNKGERDGDVISENERSIFNRYLINRLEDIMKGHYQNPNLNTAIQLYNFLKNPTYGFKYNKDKFK